MLLVELVDVAYMIDVEDAEVMHDVIVAKTETGLWYCNKLQKNSMGKHSELTATFVPDMDKVPFYEAKSWMEKRWAQITGTGVAHVENDQLRDEEIARLAKESYEESRTADDYYGFDINEAMPGAFGNEYANVEFKI